MIAYCKHCRENIDYSKDQFHYHEPIENRCSLCGAHCLSSMCRGCMDGLTEPQREEREMVGTRVRKNTDD